MPVALYLPVLVFGLIWGSFINMAVYRVRHELGFGGRSFCDHTKKELEPLDLVPVISYILFRGKCRHCKKPIPLLYPIVEIITGVSFVLVFAYFYAQALSYQWLWTNFILAAVFVGFFIFFAAYDYLYWLVNVKAVKLALGFAVIAAGTAVFVPELFLDGLDNLLAGAIAGGIIKLIIVLTKGSGMGEGDIYLMAFSGVFVGLPGLLPLFLISSVTGSLVGIIKALRVKKLHGVQIQFVPFISFAALVTFFFYDLLLNWLYLDYSIF